MSLRKNIYNGVVCLGIATIIGSGTYAVCQSSRAEEMTTNDPILTRYIEIRSQLSQKIQLRDISQIEMDRALELLEEEERIKGVEGFERKLEIYDQYSGRAWKDFMRCWDL